MKTVLLLALMLAGLPPVYAASATGLLYQGGGRAFTETKAVDVQTSDLDLTKDTDKAKLVKRMRYAMASICGAAPANAAVRLQREYGECKRSLALDAQAQMDPDRNAAFNLALARLD